MSCFQATDTEGSKRWFIDNYFGQHNFGIIIAKPKETQDDIGHLLQNPLKAKQNGHVRTIDNRYIYTQEAWDKEFKISKPDGHEVSNH